MVPRSSHMRSSLYLGTSHLDLRYKTLKKIARNELLIPLWQVGANIITMYPSTSLFIAVGQLAIVILVLFSYPLQVHPCRSCIDKVLHPDRIDSHSTVAVGDEGEIIDDHPNKELSTLSHTLLTTVIIVSGFMIAYIIDDLRLGEFSARTMCAPGDSKDTVLSFVGSTGSTTISFILPGLFYWKV